MMLRSLLKPSMSRKSSIWTQNITPFLHTAADSSIRQYLTRDSLWQFCYTCTATVAARHIVLIIKIAK